MAKKITGNPNVIVSAASNLNEPVNVLESGVEAPEVKEEVTTQPEENVTPVVNNDVPYKATIETSFEDLIDCVEKKRNVVFTAGNLPVLSEEIIRELPYKMAQGFFVERQKELDGMKPAEPRIEYGKMIGGANSELVDKLLRPRRGYHQTWRTPDQFDESLRYGYTQIRENRRDSYGNFCETAEPGYEQGEVIKLKTGDGKVELIAMEIPLRVIEEHNQAVSNLSNQAYEGNKEMLIEKIDRINADLPGNTTNKGGKLAVVGSEVDG